MNIEQLKEKLSNQTEDTKLKITGYIKPAGGNRLTQGSSTVTFAVNYDYGDLLKESEEQLKSVSQDTLRQLAKSHDTDLDTAQKALDELKESIRKSITSYQSGEGSRKSKKESIISLGRNVDYDQETGDIYFVAQKLDEKILVKENYKKVNSRPKTLVKNALSENLPKNLKTYKINKTDLHKLSFL